MGLQTETNQNSGWRILCATRPRTATIIEINQLLTPSQGNCQGLVETVGQLRQNVNKEIYVSITSSEWVSANLVGMLAYLCRLGFHVSLIGPAKLQKFFTPLGLKELLPRFETIDEAQNHYQVV